MSERIRERDKEKGRIIEIDRQREGQRRMGWKGEFFHSRSVIIIKKSLGIPAVL